MNKLELSPRLAAIAALVPQGARLADVGTDHAYLPVRLLLDGGIASAVATDVNEGPLQRGRETAERYGVGTICFAAATAWRTSGRTRWTPWSSPGWGAIPSPAF